jgi:hypothetical protein
MVGDANTLDLNPVLVLALASRSRSGLGVRRYLSEQQDRENTSILLHYLQHTKNASPDASTTMFITPYVLQNKWSSRWDG